MHNNSRLAIRAAAAMIAALGMGGCGGVGISGGSVPVGTARLSGIAVRADNTNTAISNASVTLSLGPGSSQLSTAANGSFDFGSITNGTFQCTVQPAAGSALGTTWNWEFTVPANSSAKLTAAVWPATFDPATIGSIRLSASAVTMKVGETAHFVAAAFDKAGAAIPLSPSLLLDNDIGDLSPTGTFTATRAGTARITAWMPSFSAQANVTVNP